MRIRERFNPRAPCGARPRARFPLSIFLLISTHAPLAGRDKRIPEPIHNSSISTHAPLAGRDAAGLTNYSDLHNFNPRAPCGARRWCNGSMSRSERISTHAPLAGRDMDNTYFINKNENFNPRAPCGARRRYSNILRRFLRFQPTRPLRGATIDNYCKNPYKLISTHAPLAGRDSKSVQITMHIFAITDKFQMLLHRMPPVRAFCSFLMQENHADFGCEPPK